MHNRENAGKYRAAQPGHAGVGAALCWPGLHISERSYRTGRREGAPSRGKGRNESTEAGMTQVWGMGRAERQDLLPSMGPGTTFPKELWAPCAPSPLSVEFINDWGESVGDSWLAGDGETETQDLTL